MLPGVAGGDATAAAQVAAAAVAAAAGVHPPPGTPVSFLLIIAFRKRVHGRGNVWWCLVAAVVMLLAVHCSWRLAGGRIGELYTFRLFAVAINTTRQITLCFVLNLFCLTFPSVPLSYGDGRFLSFLSHVEVCSKDALSDWFQFTHFI